jgi:hypothetical protein
VNEIFATVASAADTVRLAVHDMQEKHPEVKTISKQGRVRRHVCLLPFV